MLGESGAGFTISTMPNSDVPDNDAASTMRDKQRERDIESRIEGARAGLDRSVPRPGETRWDDRDGQWVTWTGSAWVVPDPTRGPNVLQPAEYRPEESSNG